MSARLSYGVGAIAYGIKENGFAYLLLLFYNQVLGLPQNLVGIGIFIALLVDAVTDPVVGSASDNLRGRWGRRHPFMYASALPAALGFYLLWSPPAGLTTGGLFAYFLCFAVLVRIAITFYEIPSSALVAELTDDYHLRTRFLGLRHFFGWWGGLAVAVFTYAVLLVPTPETPVGVLNREGYASYAWISSTLMLLSILASTLGTHRYIPLLRRAPARRASLREVACQTLDTLREKSFAPLFISALFGALASGLTTSMSLYVNTYYWELDNGQIAMIASTLFGAALIAALVAPAAGHRLGKKTAAVTVGLVSALLAPLPIVLRELELFPANGTRALFLCLMIYQLVELTLIIVAAILVDSMVADVVEQSELRTGRRSEGVFFAARSFVRKSVSGVGVLLATALLTIVDFPAEATPGAISADTISALGSLYAPTLFLLYLLAIVALFGYRLSRESHEANLRSLALGDRAQRDN